MTPEERWTKIDNAIEENSRQIAENSNLIAENSKLIAENSKQIAENSRQIDRMGAQWETRSAQIDAQIEKNTTAIRDLIVVSRSVIESQKIAEKQFTQIHAEIKAEIERLIKAVEVFLKGFQKPNGSQ